MIKQYRKKPVVIEAIQLTNDTLEQCRLFVGKSFGGFVANSLDKYDYGMNIITLEGIMLAKENNYIIKGIKGEFYPCKPDIFEQTYELANEE